MQDKYSAEVSRSLKPYGIYQKIPDRGYKVGGGLGHSDVEPGFPDAFFITKHGGCMIEAKTGGTAFAFSEWRENQRRFWEDVMLPRGVPLWIFLSMGKTIKDVDYPRCAALIGAWTFVYLESRFGGRKSLPYEWIASDAARDYRLDWLGNGRWGFPVGNMFRYDYLKGIEPCLPVPKT